MVSEETIKRYPGTKNLIPLNTRPKGEHHLIAQKGGQRKGQTKSDGQKLRFFKQKLKNSVDLTDEQKKDLLERIEQRESFGASVVVEIEKLKNSIHPAQRVALLNTELAVGKFIHGEKIINTNFNMNVNTNFEDWESRFHDDPPSEDNNQQQ